MNYRFPTFLTIVSVLLVGMIACSQSGDGPMDSWSSGDVMEGQGFYLAGDLDSGRRVHALHDSLYVGINSLWLVSKCYLQKVDPFAVTQDDHMYYGMRLRLRSDASIECPASPLGNDTVLVLPSDAKWSETSQIFLRGAIDSLAVDKDSNPRTAPLTDLERFGRNVDSIWILDGSNTDSLFKFTFDSSFADLEKLPKKVGKNPYVVRFLHPPRLGMNYWKLIPEKCIAPRMSCTLVPDTLWTDLSFNDSAMAIELIDTNQISLRSHCKGDSTTVNYCSNKDWVRDSSKAIVSGSRLDTLWSWNTFFVEKIPRCAVLNRDTLYSFLSGSAGGSVSIWRELFVPSSSETRCGIPWKRIVDSTVTKVEFKGSILEAWLVYSLESKAIILDTALADSVLHSVNLGN